MKIPLCKPYLGQDELNSVKEVLDSGWLAHGPKGKAFEKEFSEYLGSKFAVTLNSCASALHLATLAQGIKGEVILPSFTFSASANAIVNAGAKCVFADIEYDTCNIDPEDIKKKITKNTQAIMPVHFAGQSCRMDEIMEIAAKHGLKVIEDSAECLGGTYKGKKTGSFGTGCFSFYPTKNITSGEGGMVTTNDEKLAQTVKTLSAHGIATSALQREKSEKPWLREAILPGFNNRLSDVLSAIGLVQLRKVDTMNNMRRKIASYLTRRISQIEGIEAPVEAENCKHVYMMYTIKLNGINRTGFIKYLIQNGIGASVHFEPVVHKQQYYLSEISLPITEEVSQKIVTLPIYPQMTQEEMDFILEKVDEAAKKFRL
jgi:perosamine synthetase